MLLSAQVERFSGIPIFSFVLTLSQKLNTVVEHLNPCFLTTFVRHKYLEVPLKQTCAYKSKYTPKQVLRQKCDAFNLTHDVRVRYFILLVQLSQRVIPLCTVNVAHIGLRPVSEVRTGSHDNPVVSPAKLLVDQLAGLG